MATKTKPAPIDDCSAVHVPGGLTHVCGPRRMNSSEWWIEAGRVGADGRWLNGPFRAGKTKREAETYRAELEAIIETYRERGLLNEQMPKPLTSAQVAAQVGISPRAVQALAKRRGIARVGRDWLFSPADVALLTTQQRPGRKPQPRKDK